MLLLLQLILHFLEIVLLQHSGLYPECCNPFWTRFPESPRNGHAYPPINIRMKKLGVGVNLTWNPVLLPANVQENTA